MLNFGVSDLSAEVLPEALSLALQKASVGGVYAYGVLRSAG
jgi:hypothetical protein